MENLKIKELRKKDLVYSNGIMSKLRSAAKLRRQGSLLSLKTELFGIAQSLAETSTSLNHRNKSEILRKSPSFNEYTISNSSAAVVDLSPIVKEMDVTRGETFEKFADVLYKKVFSHFKGCKRIYLIVNRYFKDGLKENL